MKKVFVAVLILLVAIICQPQFLFAAPDRTIEKSFPITMGGKLVLDLDTGGNVEIAGWGKEEIAVMVGIGGDDADRVNVGFEAGSSVLKIHSDCEKHRHADVDLHFTIKVPEKCDVSIDSRGGKVAIQDVEGELSGKTMGGALELARVKGGIRLETMGGAVKVEDSEADGTVSTMGGEVTIRNVKGNLTGSTMGGSVTYDNVTGRSASSGDEEVHISTMGGDINVDEAPAGARVTTMGGDVTIHSAGQYVKAKTMGGDIEVDAVDGAADASTMGGDITVTMTGDPKKGDREVNLSSMGGDITLTVPDGLSMKFDLEIKYTKKHHGDCKIESDFPVDIKESPEWEHGFWGQACKHIYGTGEVAGGGHLIKIRTVNGKITIKKGA